MKKARFRLLVFFMSLSLLGIILVQLYWVNSSLKNNDEQFTYHIQQVLGRVAGQLEAMETEQFYKTYRSYKDNTGKVPQRADLVKMYDSQQSGNSRKQVIFSGQLNSGYDDVLFDKNFGKDDVEDYLKKKTSSVNNSYVDKPEPADSDRFLAYQIEGFIKDFRDYKGLESWLNKDKVRRIIFRELEQNGVHTPFEFGVFYDGMATKVHSGDLHYENEIYDHKLFENSEGFTKYRLLISFPQKQKYIVSRIMGMASLSLVFTLIIVIAYLSAINQLIKQKNISEIKTDFINNMTHEFKTPIATINLALDAIKNPKIFDNKERVQYYLQMIREENKRMHSQVENVLQISKLDKNELDIPKEATDVDDILEEAVEHVNLIIEDREGSLTMHLGAKRTTALLNHVHFTNVIVNILDNAIKYSPENPVIDIYTENIKDFILIKIKDQGLGMSKSVQKLIFEKFYREHTGDRHDVKGHGLGLAYVKRIVDDHNGHISVESEKGKGSTFIIKMPLIN
jgi:two-component system phosphate regulon sensor histidine kinase PhoR